MLPLTTRLDRSVVAFVRKRRGPIPAADVLQYRDYNLDRFLRGYDPSLHNIHKVRPIARKIWFDRTVWNWASCMTNVGDILQEDLDWAMSQWSDLEQLMHWTYEFGSRNWSARSDFEEAEADLLKSYGSTIHNPRFNCCVISKPGHYQQVRWSFLFADKNDYLVSKLKWG